MAEPQHEWGKVVMKPANEGEEMKIQQTVLRRRDRNLEYQARRQQMVRKLQSAKMQKPDLGIVTVEKIIAKSLHLKRSAQRVRRVVKGNVKKEKVDKNSKVLLVVRNMNVDPCSKSRHLLKKYRLETANRAVFLPNTPEVLKNLQMIQHFVYFGYPTKETVDQLMQKLARFRNAETSKVSALSDNRLVEEQLGHLGLLCVEDLVATILKCEGSFGEMSRLMLPFVLADHRKVGRVMKRTEGCRRGNQKLKINEQIQELMGR